MTPCSQLKRKWQGVAAAVIAASLLCASVGNAWADAAEDGMAPPARGRQPAVTSSSVQYVVPDVTLIRQDGKSVSLPQEMNDGRPVILNFIFTTCGSICPLMSQVMGQFQRKLGSESQNVHLMSISIDPEEDTPPRLREYASQFGAGPGWNHYTGTLTASQEAQRAFGVYRGDKMSHTPVTLVRAAPGQPWLRIDGFVTPDQLLMHYHQLLAAQ